jgi:hypothetical protein
MGDISLTWMGERPAELQEALSSLNTPAAEEPIDPFDLSAFEEEDLAEPAADKNDFDTLFNQLSYSHEDTPAEKHTMSGNPEYDWLSALSDSDGVPVEDEEEAEPAAFNSSGTGFTGWLNEATLESAEDSKQSKTINELFGPSASLEVSDFTEEEPEEEAEDVGGSGFTGWLSQDLPDEFADIEDIPSEQAGFTGWLNAEDAPEEPAEDESPASTGFTSWLSAPAPSAQPDELPDWLDEPDPPAKAQVDNFTNWVQQVSSDPAAEKDSSGFTDWLNEAATGSFDSSILQPERVTTDEKAPPPAERGFTDWLSEDDAHFPPAAAQPTGGEDEEIPAWLQPFDNPQQSQTATSTGFTDFLENSPTAESLPATSDGAQLLDAPKTDEIPAWLDVPMEEEPSADVPPLGVGTGFTGWLDESKVPSLPPITQPAASPEELPDWLAQAEPAIPTAEGDSRGLTDWLAENHGHPEEEDDEDDDVLLPDAQLLMKPLSAEEAQKILAETPPVSDNFITEVVEEDFPDWLTDVKTSEDISDTETIPGWIRAPLTDSDRLTLSLHGENYVEDDWLADVPDESQQSRPYRGTGWLTSLGTLHEENFSWVKPDEEMLKSAAIQPAAEEWEEEDEELDISQITENDRDQAGLSWMFGAEESGEAAGDDWLSGFGEELPAEPSVAHDEEADWLPSAPSQAALPAAGDDWLSGFGEELPAESAVANDEEADWLTSAPSQPSANLDNDDWLGDMPSTTSSSAASDGWLDDLTPPATPAENASWMEEMIGEDNGLEELDWLDQPAPAKPTPKVNLTPTPVEPEEEPALPLDPALDYDNLEMGWQEEAQEGSGFDWLSALEGVDLTSLPAEPALNMELPEEGLGEEDGEEELIDFDQIESLNPEELVISNPTFALMDASELGLLSELQHLGETEESTPEEELALEEELLEFEASAAPAWVEDIGGDETDFRQVVQATGPLAGLRGVVAIAPLLAQPAVAPTTIQEIALKNTEEQAQQAQLLKQITAGVVPQVEEEDTVSRSRFEQLIRVFLAILLILAVLGGLFLPAGTLPITPPAAGPALVNFNQAITSFSGQKLLVAIDYTPAVGGELDPMALMVLKQLQAQNNQLVVMSQFPTGWGQAQQLLASTNFTGTTELGYIPGRTVGLRELATCLTQTIGCLNLNATALSEVKAVIVFTNERDSLLDWLEQVQPEIQKKGQLLLVGTTEGLAPMAQPYVESQQIGGLIAGTPELATYETQFLGQAGPAYQLLSGRVLAQILALVVLLVGAVIHALPNRQTPK